MRIGHSTTLFWGFATIVALNAVQASAQVQYTVTDLGNFDAAAINNSGQIVGSFTDAGVQEAYLYSNGVFTQLGGGGSEATGINNNGEIVGEAANHAAILAGNPGGPADLGGIPPSDPLWSSYATGVNDSGEVVGYSTTIAYLDYGSTGGFLDRNETFLINLETIYPVAINDSGEIAGTDYRANQAAVYFNNGSTEDLGTLGGTSSFATAINASGQVVGQSLISGNATSHAFLYSNGNMTDLGALGGDSSIAYGVNDSGQVVGDYTLDDGASSAFIYANGSMMDLNNFIPASSGWTVTGAYAINDTGEILGASSGGETILLTPVDVPEPGSISLLAVIGYGLLARRRAARQKQELRSYGREIGPDAQ
jgi:probable HAF family extracellular repeat protein